MTESARIQRFKSDNIQRCKFIFEQASATFGPKKIFGPDDEKYVLENYMRGKKIPLPELDFMLTNACTLKCDQCLSLIPAYQKSQHFFETVPTFKNRLDKLLNEIDFICRVNVTGGEPLLVQDLPQILDYAASSPQIKYLALITNCTIKPDSRLLETLKQHSDKIYVVMSDYSEGSEKQNNPEEFSQIFKRYGIRSWIARYPWYKRGPVKRENRSETDLIKIKQNCRPRYVKVYCEGDLYPCTTAVGIRKLLDQTIRNFVAVENSHDSLTSEITNLFTAPCFDSCAFCHHEFDEHVPRGKQR